MASGQDDLRSATRRKPSFLQTMRAVFWSFFGVRKGSEHEQDIARLNPVHVILAGLLAVALFIAGLLLIVRTVLS